MPVFLATLSAAAASNWAICKRHGLWGTGTSTHAKHAARTVAPGDDLFVWQSEAGLIARASILTAAREVTDPGSVPWPEPQRYSYTFGIEVQQELDEPFRDRFKDHRSIRFGIRTHELQAGLIQISDEVAASLRSALHDVGDAPRDDPEPSERLSLEVEASTETQPEVPHRDRRWARPMAGVYLRPASTVTEVLLTLYRRVADDEDGELLVVGDERDRGRVEHELSLEPFIEMRGRVRFVTGDELPRSCSDDSRGCSCGEARLRGAHMTPARSQKAHFRLLLFSDLMLDRPYEWAPPAVADARRTAAREALVKILGAARAHHVDVIACAGDLFDRRTVAPSTTQWLIAALRSATTQVLIAPGNRDFVGPLGGYSRHEWSDNVTVFDTDRFTAVDVSEGVTIWGAAHTEAHRACAFFDRFEADRDGINLALFHGAERSGVEREPGMEPCARFDESAVAAAGFDHALVGHYQRAHFGLMHTYSGAPIAHELGNGVSGAAVLVTLADDGTIEREQIELWSPALHDVEVDLTGAKSARDAVKRAGAPLAECSGIVRLRLTGRVAPDIVLQRDDFAGLVSSAHGLLLDWEAEVDVDLDELAEEQTVRGQFVRDVLASRSLSDERRQRVLLTGLRALAGSDVLEGPR